MSNEDKKRQRFINLASHRTNEVIKRIKILGNCANKSTYEYSDEDIKKIFTVIDSQLRDTKAKFRGEQQKEKKFQLT